MISSDDLNGYSIRNSSQNMVDSHTVAEATPKP